MPDLDTVLKIALLVASIGHTVAKWFEHRSARQSAAERRAGQAARIARAVYDAAEATAQITGARGDQKWAVARLAIPKAAKAAGLDVTPELISDVEQLVSLFAMQDKKAPNGAASRR